MIYSLYYRDGQKAARVSELIAEVDIIVINLLVLSTYAKYVSIPVPNI